VKFGAVKFGAVKFGVKISGEDMATMGSFNSMASIPEKSTERSGFCSENFSDNVSRSKCGSSIATAKVAEDRDVTTITALEMTAFDSTKDEGIFPGCKIIFILFTHHINKSIHHSRNLVG
jgi:hypothetical protein